MGSAPTSRERVLRALDHQETDRIPIDFGGSSTSLIHRLGHERLAAHLGLPDAQGRLAGMMTQGVVPDARILEMFGADVLLINPGKPDAWTLQLDPHTNSYTDEWGARLQQPEGCDCYEYADHPLKEGTAAELERYPWPDPRDPGRYRGLEERVRELHERTGKALLANNPFRLWEQTWALRGLENAFCDLGGSPATGSSSGSRPTGRDAGAHRALRARHQAQRRPGLARKPAHVAGHVPAYPQAPAQGPRQVHPRAHDGQDLSAQRRQHLSPAAGPAGCRL
jgi:hypothetical protein